MKLKRRLLSSRKLSRRLILLLLLDVLDVLNVLDVLVLLLSKPYYQSSINKTRSILRSIMTLDRIFIHLNIVFLSMHCALIIIDVSSNSRGYSMSI